MSNDPFGVDILSFFPLFCGERPPGISRVTSQLTQQPFHPSKKMVAQQIDKAKALYDAYGSALRDDQRVHVLIENYRNAIARTYGAMA